MAYVDGAIQIYFPKQKFLKKKTNFIFLFNKVLKLNHKNVRYFLDGFLLRIPGKTSWFCIYQKMSWFILLFATYCYFKDSLSSKWMS